MPQLVVYMKVNTRKKDCRKLKDKCFKKRHAAYSNRCASCKKRETDTMKILLANRKIEGKAITQIAHLVFADTQNANPKKPKELFFVNPH